MEQRMTLDGKSLDPGVCARYLDTATCEPPVVRDCQFGETGWRAKLDALRERIALRLAPWLEPYE